MIRELFERGYAALTARLPRRVAAFCDHLRPSLGDSWGGPMNGQAGRRELVRDLARRIRFERVVETGTYRGTTTQFLAHVFGTPLDTAEVDPRFHHYAARRLGALAEVELFLGDSRSLLARLVETSAARGEVTFFYLDAHWRDDLPLTEELTLIVRHWDTAVVMIDDFRVDGDDGYRFDDYGPGKRLTTEILPPLGEWVAYFPVLASQRETGAKRGCCVLASASLAGALDACPLLRRVAS